MTRPRTTTLLPLLLTAGLTAVLCGSATASPEWPRLGGPDGNHVVEGVELATDWPDAGPEVVWEVPLGKGYSGISVADGRAFTMYRTEDDTEVTAAFDLGTGETVWSRSVPAPFAEYHRMEHGSGPHITPLVVTPAEGPQMVISAGIYGDLTAQDAATGEVVWVRQLVREMGGTEMDRGYSNSPILHESRVIVPVGGEGQGLMALDAATGEEVWSSQDFDNSYSTPALITVDGQEQIVFFSPAGIVAIAPEDGGLLWTHPHETMYGLNISVPIYDPEDQLLFVSSAYNGGSRVLKLSQSDGETSVEELWAHKQMRIHIGNAMRVGDVVWGANGDFGAVPFTGVKVADGEIAYRTRDVARTFILMADGKFLLLDEDGLLTLATPRPDGLEIHEQHQLLESKTWTPPTLVGNLLLARDQMVLKAVRLP